MGSASRLADVLASDAPPEDLAQDLADEISSTLAALEDWLGLVAIDARDALASAPAPPDPLLPSLDVGALAFARGGTCEARRWSGMLSARSVVSLLREAAALVDEGALPWAALQVSGFADAPVSWGLQEHDVQPGTSDNDFTLVVLPEGRCVLYSTINAPRT